MTDTTDKRNTGISAIPNGLHITSRYAEQGDLADVLEMYMAALEEIKDYITKPDLDQCAETVFKSWSGAPTILIELAGKIIGFAGLRAFKPHHSGQTCLTEYMFFIRPAMRSLRAAKALSDAVQAVADKFKLPLYMSHMVFDVPLAVKERFLKRWNYEVISLSVAYGRQYGGQ